MLGPTLNEKEQYWFEVDIPYRLLTFNLYNHSKVKNVRATDGRFTFEVDDLGLVDTTFQITENGKLGIYMPVRTDVIEVVRDFNAILNEATQKQNKIEPYFSGYGGKEKKEAFWSKKLIEEIYLPTLQWLNELEKTLRSAIPHPNQLLSAVKYFKSRVQRNPTYLLATKKFQSEMEKIVTELYSGCRRDTFAQTIENMQKIRDLAKKQKPIIRKLVNNISTQFDLHNLVN